MKGPSKDAVAVLLSLAGVLVLVYAAVKSSAKYHPVTPTMAVAAEAMAGEKATDLEAPGTDGRTHSLAKDSKSRPLVVFFIQSGCPCSEGADPYFGRLQAAYASSATFLGVIDGDLATAREWSKEHQTRYPILADPYKKLIAASKAERSAYVMLVKPGGQVETLWPGYSSAMLVDLGRRLAELTGTVEVVVDTAAAPETLASGCSF